MVKFPLNELTKSLYIFCWIFCYPFFVIPLMPTRPTLCKYGKSRIENPSWFEGRLDSSAAYGQSAKYKGYQLFFGEYFIFSLFSWSSGSWDWVRRGYETKNLWSHFCVSYYLQDWWGGCYPLWIRQLGIRTIIYSGGSKYYRRFHQLFIISSA